MLTAEMQTKCMDVETAGFNTRLLCSGDGHDEALLLLHGGGLGVEGRTNWLDNVERFGASFFCVVPDLVGFGATEHPTVTPSQGWLGLRVAQCLALLDKLGLERAHVVGNSAGGGALALALLRQAPGRVAGIVLLGGAGVGAGENDRSVAPARSLALYDDPSTEAMESMLERFSAAPDRLPISEIAQRRFQTACRPEVRRSFEAMWTSGAEAPAVTDAELQAIDRPILILHGREDALADPERSRRLAALLPKGDLCVLAGAGHWLHLDRLTAFQSLASTFFREADV